MTYGTLLLGFDHPCRVRVLGEPRGVMVYAGRWCCRYSWSWSGRFGNGSRWSSGWHDWTKQPDC